MKRSLTILLRCFFLFCFASAVMPANAQRAVVASRLKALGIEEKIIDPTMRKRPENYSFDLAFTTVVADKEKKFLASYDGSKTGEDRWLVKSVNGKAPSKGDINRFMKQHRTVPDATLSVDESTWKIEKEDKNTLILSYKPSAATLPEEASFMKDCRTYLTIDLKTKRLEKLKTLNEIPLKVKIAHLEKLELNVNYQFNEESKRYLPLKEDVVMLIQFMGQMVSSETISEYSSYQKN
jgi:hypothetical protein